MMKLHKDAVKYVNNLIDENTILDDTDYEYLAAAIIQATPIIDLPAIDDFDTDMVLLDMLAAYMKTSDPAKGDDILDYIVKNITKYYQKAILNLIQEKRDESASARREAKAENDYQQYVWNKERA